MYFGKHQLNNSQGSKYENFYYIFFFFFLSQVNTGHTAPQISKQKPDFWGRAQHEWTLCIRTVQCQCLRVRDHNNGLSGGTYDKLCVGVDGASSEGNILPGDDDDVFRFKDGGSHNALPDVPLDSLSDLHPELVLPWRQVAHKPVKDDILSKFTITLILLLLEQIMSRSSEKLDLMTLRKQAVKQLKFRYAVVSKNTCQFDLSFIFLIFGRNCSSSYVHGNSW